MEEKREFGRPSVVAAVGGTAGGAPAEEGQATLGGPTGRSPGARTGPFAPAAEKYAVEARLGMGGMGEVLLVSDRDLRRTVAMKVMRAELAGSPAHRLDFVAEAQATSQLEHPGIPPVHDIGISPGGEIFFTMKLVRGRTLREVLKDLLVGRREARQEFSLHRLVTVLERVAEAVHFAHEKGVIHRDLKPENVMLGDYGEVHVMDWGIAKVAGREDGTGAEERVTTDGTDSGMHTLDGTVKGTPAYMSPEQASGAAASVDRRSDVYALGALLYEMLTLYPAFEGREILPRVRRGEFVPVESRNPKREAPAPLAATCRRAMARLPGERHPTARELAEEIRAWLDGTSERARRHQEAEALAMFGKEASARHERLQAELAAAEEGAEAEEGRFPASRPVAEKRPLYEARERVVHLRREAVLAFAETTRLFEGALLAEEENTTARGALADLWARRLLDAERRADGDEAAYALTMIGRYDDGRHAALVKGDGSLALETDPPGAEAVLFRFSERDGVLVPGEERALGAAPLGPVPLPMGSYLVLLRLPGFREVRYPVQVTRGRAWVGRVRMRTDAEIGEGFVLVPEGPFLYGEGKGQRPLALPDFAIARHPVTFAEYAEFLAACEAAAGPAAALERLPRTPGDGPFMERTAPGAWHPTPNNCEGPTRERCIRAFGPDFEMRLPVSGVSHDDALAWCAWKSRATGRQWRLPTEEEREKASRGVDGRRFPWGEVADASLAKCRDSRDEHPQPEPVGAFPTATSVYGMGDAAGNFFDWTDSWFDARGTFKALRGGSWVSEVAILRCAYRFWREPAGRTGIFTFRPARSLP